jgi:hypothetical protein
VLFENPSLAEAALVSRPSGTHYLDLVEAILALLHEGGVPDDQAAWGLDLLLQFATATAVEQGVRSRAIDAADEWDALGAALSRTDPAIHPRISALGAELMSGPGHSRLAWGFDVLINGVLHTPRPTTSPEEK